MTKDRKGKQMEPPQETSNGTWLVQFGDQGIGIRDKAVAFKVVCSFNAYDARREMIRELLEALRKGHNELNRIRAADGVPYHYDGIKSDVLPEYFSSVVDEMSHAIAKAEKLI